MFKFLIHTQQSSENDCGVACYYMILKSHGYNVSYMALKKKLMKNYLGTSIFQMKKFSDSINLETHIYKPNFILENIRKINISNKELPCIAYIHYKDISHFIVIYKIKKGVCTYSDPSQPTVNKTDSISFMQNIKYLISFNFENDLELDRSLILRKENNYIYKIVMEQINPIIKITLISVLVSLIGIFLSSKTGILINSISLSEYSLFNIFLMYFTILLIILTLTNNCIKYIKNVMSIKVIKTIENKINKSLVFNLIHQHYSDLKFFKSGEIMSRINDCMTVSVTVSSFILSVLPNLLIALFCLLVLLFMNVKITLLLLIAIIINIIIAEIVFKKVYENNYLTVNSFADYYSDLAEIINSLSEIKAMQGESFHFNRISNSLKQYNDISTHKDIYANNVVLNQDLLSNIFSLIIIVLCILFVVDGRMAVGSLTIIVMLSDMLQRVCMSIINFQFDFENFLVSYNRIMHIFQLDLKEENKNLANYKKNIVLDKIKTIQLKNFGIYYGNKFIVENVNILMSSRNIIIRGESGCGKSSLAKCIAFLENNYVGKILINGKEITNHVSEYQSKFIYLGTNTILFSGTILDNICFGKKILFSTLQKVCTDFCLMDLIDSYEDGFYHEIKANQINISAGQKQRIALIRAVLLEPDVLILDEALSNVDNYNKNIILKNLEKYPFIKIHITHNDFILPSSEQFVFKDKTIIRL